MHRVFCRETAIKSALNEMGYLNTIFSWRIGRLQQIGLPQVIEEEMDGRYLGREIDAQRRFQSVSRNQDDTNPGCDEKPNADHPDGYGDIAARHARLGIAWFGARNDSQDDAVG
jgi:hypothetical protein